ncbi:MAG: ABC transporter ATP-binding protein [Actinobacteria bacterium]|nr:ABC transporter ATP-binding protein [Actinomycetota bacterium]MBU1865011.1 ABC transporter ATP-binding protein [Actinomycetota bacterium]
MISTTGLVKEYAGTAALDGVSLTVPTGSVFGLVGPNGAGKTTLLSILAGLRSPTSGSVAIDAPPSAIAVLPDAPRFDPWLTGREVVGLAARLAAPGREGGGVDRSLGEAGLTEAADRRVGGYSRGMLQRLGIAATVVSDPAVMLLDEPASALDPVGRREVLDLVRRARGKATVVFSSHILADVQEVCDHLAILHEGTLLFQGEAADLLAGRAEPIYLVRIRSGRPAAAAALARRPWVTEVVEAGDRDLRIRVATVEDAERGLVAALAEAGAAVISIQPQAPTLEDVFLEVTS